MQGSQTINMPVDAGKEDIGKALIYAWKQGLKGLKSTGEADNMLFSI